MNIFDRIKKIYDSFSPNEKKIADYILNNANEFSRKDIQKINEIIGVSNAAMIRFAKKLDFSGYSALKYEITRCLIQNNYSSDNTKNDIINSVTSNYIDAINKINSTLDLEEINNAAKAVIESNRVKVYAFSKSAHSASQFCDRCLSVGVETIPTFNDSFKLSSSLELSTNNDMIIIFTTEDNTKAFTKAIDLIKQSGAKLIVVTMDNSLSLLKNATFKFILPKVTNSSDSNSPLNYRDDQLLFDIFTEIFVVQLAKIQKI